MSKFNTTVTTKTVNKCGVPAFRMDVKDKLVPQVLYYVLQRSKILRR